MKINYLKNLRALLFSLAFMGLSGTVAFAGEPVEASFGADLVSTYLWRGQKLDDFSIQPSMSLDWKGLSLGVWGSTDLHGNYRECDFSLGYTVGGFSIIATDYFCTSDDINYFDFSPETPHVVELGAVYDFGPVAVSWYSNLLGATGYGEEEGEKVMSSYFEVSAPFSMGGLDWSAAVGGTPFANTFYGADGFAVTNVSLTASKEVAICNHKLPVFAQIMANPKADRLYLAVGISF